MCACVCGLEHRKVDKERDREGVGGGDNHDDDMKREGKGKELWARWRGGDG